MNATLSECLLAYMRHLGYKVATVPGHCNIIYVEGMNGNGSLNDDRADAWNDLRLIVLHTPVGLPVLVHMATSTTEPGRAPTMSPDARTRGGVARIAFGQYEKAWRMGYHKPSRNGKNHPALVQAAPLPVHRDKNRDGLRTRDTVHLGMFGINQHGTRPGFTGDSVGFFSEGCLVGQSWERHLDFIATLRRDPRYLADTGFLFTTTIIAGDAMVAWEKQQTQV